MDYAKESLRLHEQWGGKIGNFRLGTAICIVVGNAQRTALHNGTLA